MTNVEMAAALMSNVADRLELKHAEAEQLEMDLNELRQFTLKAAKKIADLGEWQPIETAPKDGTPILAFDEGAIMIVIWFNADGQTPAGWWDNGIMDPPPSHWMPLPDPPTVRA